MKYPHPRLRLDLLGLLLADMVLLWIATSVLRGKGLLAFAAGLAALLVALLAFRAGRRRPLYVLSFAALLAAVTVLSVEGLLRFSPGILKGRLATFTFEGYHSERDGIYRPDPHLGRALRPGFQRWMYWNGHWWRHATNEDGYRGAQAAPGAAVFLGDSMVYGHGVQADETVPARFAALTGKPAANLGQQGTCLVQGWMLLRERAATLRPRAVYACAHPTDPADAPYWYAPDELERFSSTQGYVPSVRSERLGPGGPFAFWSAHVALPLRSARMLVVLLKPGAAPAAGSAGSGLVPSQADLEIPFDPQNSNDGPGWQAHREALRRLKRTCDEVGARLVVFDLGYPHAFSRAVEASARAAGAEYDPAGRVVLERALRGEEMYLRNDGHWSPRGADAVARELARSAY